MRLSLRFVLRSCATKQAAAEMLQRELAREEIVARQRVALAVAQQWFVVVRQLVSWGRTPARGLDGGQDRTA